MQTIRVADLQPGDIARFVYPTISSDPLDFPPVRILKVERDRMGFDVLYDPQDGRDARWTGFGPDDTATIEDRRDDSEGC